MSAVSVRNVSFRYPGHDKWILNNFSIDIKEQKVLAIIGKSGCGKSTLIRLIAGLLQPNKGTITTQSSHQLGMVFQDPRLLPWKTVFCAPSD